MEEAAVAARLEGTATTKEETMETRNKLAANSNEDITEDARKRLSRNSSEHIVSDN